MILENLSPTAVYGGLIIGLAATILLLCNGRIAGISGVLFNLFNNQNDKAWRLAFLVGLFVGGYWVLPVDFSLREGFSPIILALSGLLVGIGTRLSNGCTSGHGVCGIGLISKRSIIATPIFLITAIITVALMKLVY